MQARVALLGLVLTSMAWAQRGPGFITDPKLPDDAITKVSDHVYVILGFPNVGIIVGSEAVMVVDTGLGPKNGATVVRQVRKLSSVRKLYLTTTHFHPEHAAGDAGFPADSMIVRPQVQQAELERDGEAVVARFRENPAFAPFLEGVTFRKPQVLFDRQQIIDLGGVHVRLMWLGPAHTEGDEEIWVEEDRTLLPGDLGIKDSTPRSYAKGSNAQVWAGILDQLIALKPLHVVPDHGVIGDVRLLAEQRQRILPP